jgi:hypothetical protein
VTYSVVNWGNHFENSESKKYVHLKWVPIPNKHDGSTYRRVVAHPKSVQIFCGWCLILEVASKMPTRGVLHDGNRALTALDLHFKTGFPKHVFDVAFEVLVDKDINWLAVEDLRKPSETFGETTAEQNRTEQNRTEQNRTEETPLPPSGDLVLKNRIGNWFKRKESTPWSDREEKQFKKIHSFDLAEVAILERYYTGQHPKEADYRRRDLITLLNNWEGEIDRAKKWNPTIKPAQRTHILDAK